MKAPELRTLLKTLLSETEEAISIAQTADRGKHSFSGHGRYADRFHEAVVTITGTEKKVRPHLDGLGLPADELVKFDGHLAILKDTVTKAKGRVAAQRALKLVCETVILPKADGMTASPVPSTESVLPMDVVKGTRGYLETIVTQINGCYEHQWYDACSVMVRKLAEILIIAVYEHKGEAQEIKGADGNFLMLSGLIAHIKSKIAWNLGRETKPCLDKMKELGDRSAHNRHYIAKKADVDGLKSGLRVTVDDLLHQAGLK
ncbi:MAG: hypothetical protein ACRC33_32100 [Gemmataceae bacterium]